MSVSAQAEWTVRLTVEPDDFPPFLRTFGVADGATDGYNILHDIPLFLSDGDTTAFFPVSAMFITALSTDMRNARSAHHRWDLLFQNMPMSAIQWEIDSLPETGIFQASAFHADSTPADWVDMRISAVIVIPEGFHAAFRWSVPFGEDTIPPYVTAWSPPHGAVGVPRETAIYCEVYDDGAGVDEGTIELIVNGIGVTWLSTITAIEGGFSVHYEPPLAFGWDSDVRVILSAYDLETPANYVSDTVVWRTVADSMGHTVSGVVGTGDPLTPLSGAVVTIAGKADTTDFSGNFSIGDISTGFYTLRAQAEGYSTRTYYLPITADTTLQIRLNEIPPPDVLLIDFDSGSRPHIDGGDTLGEDDIVADQLSLNGYSFDRTSQNPSILDLRLDDYTYVVLVTPVRSETPHEVIPDAHLNVLSDWVEDGGRLLWIAPNAGDYADGTPAGQRFFELFGAVFESEGRPAEPTGNVDRLSGEARWFILNVDARYGLNSPADNYIAEFSPADEFTHTALASQSSSPAPVSAGGRVMFRDLPEHRAVISSILFGSINDGFFPNNKSAIFRACMDFLGKEFSIYECAERPSTMSISAHPNPFNGNCRLIIDDLGLGIDAIEIFDVAGRVVANIPVGEGPRAFPLDGNAKNGSTQGPSPTTRELLWQPAPSLPSGAYLVKANVGEQSITKRVVYLK